jgi:hypothetical protein
VLILAGCSPAPDVLWKVPEVPSELRQPCNVAPREAETLQDVALILTDHVEALDCANGRIVAIDAILAEVEIKK